MENSPLTLVAYAAILALGATIVPANPAEKGEFFEGIALDCGAVGMITSERAKAAPPSSMRLGLVMTDEVLQPSSPATKLDDIPPPQPATLATIIYTSGTTGRSKGVLLTQGNWLINAEALRRLHRMESESVHMCVLPLFHVNAFGFSFVATLIASARLILNRTFYGPSFWTIAGQERVQVASVAPAIVRILVEQRHAPITARDLPDFRYLVSAAAALPGDLLRAFLDKFQLRIFQGYGVSEATNFNLTCDPRLSAAEYEQIMFEKGRPSAGAALFGHEVALMEADGRLLGDDEEGEIVIRGWSVGQGYFAASDLNSALFSQGWLHTGDTAKSASFGGVRYFYITGRLKEMIKRSGEVIAPIDMEEQLRRLPGLEDCVVVGFENDASGEEVGLFVVPNAATRTPDEILAACLSCFPAYRAPKVVVIGESIPVTSTGKIKRRQLASAFAEFKSVRY
jgi:long-chain acyl-CoA synthetase